LDLKKEVIIDLALDYKIHSENHVVWGGMILIAPHLHLIFMPHSLVIILKFTPVVTFDLHYGFNTDLNTALQGIIKIGL
jgi:hypothetical protein